MNIESLLSQAQIIAKEVTAKEAETTDANGTWVEGTMRALQQSVLS